MGSESDNSGVAGYEDADKILEDVMERTKALEYMMECMLQRAESASNGGLG